MEPRIAVTIGTLKLANPVMTASGTFGCGEEYQEFFDIARLGAIVTKTITLAPRVGNAPPRVAETASGMLNSIGLENRGLNDFIDEKVPFLKRLKGAKVIASIAGNDSRQFRELASRLEGTGSVHAFELNLSCPNIRHASMARSLMIAQDAAAVRTVVRLVRKATSLALIAKLSPNVTDIRQIAKAAEDAGADAVSLINTFPALAVDVKTRSSALGNVTGGLSGPAIKPLALKMVYDASRAVKVPIVGIGGIMTAEDALEFILCGATAVQVGTACFVNPRAPLDVLEGIEGYLVHNRIRDLRELIGALGRNATRPARR